MAFAPNHTYEVVFDYRVLATLGSPDDGFNVAFFSPTAADQNRFLADSRINQPAGASGRLVHTTTLEEFSDYFLLFNVIGRGAIAIENVRVTDLTTEAVILDDDLERDVTVQIQVPLGWSDVTADYLIAMPGWVLEQGSTAAANRVIELVYDPISLHRDFPNIDLTARHDFAPGLSDEIFVSLLLSGTDQSGQAVYAAKHITLVGEDLYNLN